jgi:hypothetical protein
MARQITDLSAAGANLFHAVVELQRLHASSERKFQRWFFEIRGSQSDLEKMLQKEQENRAIAEKDRADATQMAREMRRELSISKEEARRAWDELGRREKMEGFTEMLLSSPRPPKVFDISDLV